MLKVKPTNRSLRRAIAGLALVMAGAVVAAGAVVISARDAQQARAQHLQTQFEALHLAHSSLEEQTALVALERHLQHPTWQELSVSERIAQLAKVAMSLKVASPTAPTPTAAPFRGNTTALMFTHTGDSAFVLQRQSDCSLSLLMANYSFGASVTTGLSITAATSATTHYEQTLHTAAGLTTTADSATSCSDPASGMAAQRTVYLGKAATGALIVAGIGYVPGNSNGNSVLYGTVDPSGTTASTLHLDTSAPGVASFATGDLNGDGRPDLIGVDALNAQIVVWLTQSDGTLSTPVTYPVAGQASGAVVADVNGDGKADVVVASESANAVSVLTGNGDGTLNTAQSFTVAAPQGQGHPVQAVVAADLRHVGYPDLVLSNGWIYRNNGSGAFTQVTTAAFPPIVATSSFGPGLVAADFNKDGKLDLALDDGPVINLYYGNGDDTFTAGPAYASVGNVGYIGASDLDADGNVDLWSGLAAGGVFGGDQYNANQALALLGKGDGSFQGAPSLPFVFTGNNIADLNGDGIPDAIGVNADFSMSSYLGSTTGVFASGSAIALSPAPINGNQDAVSQIDGYAVADVSGDGKPDLIVSVRGQMTPSVSQLLLLLGNGQGGFGTPTALSAPVFAPQGQTDTNLEFADIRLLDVNGDGKQDLLYFYTDQYGSTFTAGTAVQLGNGDGTFQAPLTIPFYSQTSASPLTSKLVATADLNGDGKTDLVFLTQTATYDGTLGSNVAQLQIALGHGDGTFATPVTVTGPTEMGSTPYTGGNYAPVAIADMNGDGKPDLIAIGADSNYDSQVAVILGKGDGTFLAPTLQSYSSQYLNGMGLAIADFNADGNQDVFISNPESPLGSGIAFGNGDGTLQFTGDQYGSYVSQSVALSTSGPATSYDINGDGKPDVLVGSVELLSVAATSSGTGGGDTTSANFSLSASPPSATVTAGSAATTTLTVTPTGGFASPVALSCSGLPAQTNCAFSPTTVTPNGAAATSTLTITTAAKSAANSAPGGWLFGSSGTLLATLLLPVFVGRSRRFATGTRLVMGAVMSALLLSSCGGGGQSTGNSGGTGPGSGSAGTTPGTYTVTLSGVSGSTTHTTTFSLTVN